MKIPQKGIEREELMKRLTQTRGEDADASKARLFSLVYATRPDVLAVAKEAYTAFFSENALNPMAFPSLRRMETELVSMTASLLNAPEGAVGNMTSGGSESILLAVKTARDWAKANKPNITAPEILVCETAHPAFFKAAHTLEVKPVVVPMGAGFAADVEAAKKLITDDTILVVGSAPQYPHGVMDPITDLAKLASERGILCHVDGCFGGFMLPWLEKLGKKIPSWDFRVPGVTSISADLHKYGYTAKGASVVVYRERALRRHQFFVHSEWPGGLFGSPSMLGTRPGGAIAAAWAVLQYVGEEGYLDLAKRALSATEKIAKGVRQIEGLSILGEPVMTAIAISGNIDVYVVGDRMREKGWFFDRGQKPPSLHLTVSPAHDAITEEFLADLAECVEGARSTREQPQGTAAMYGMLGTLPDRAFVREALLEFMDGLDAG